MIHQSFHHIFQTKTLLDGIDDYNHLILFQFFQHIPSVSLPLELKFYPAIFYFKAMRLLFAWSSGQLVWDNYFPQNTIIQILCCVHNLEEILAYIKLLNIYVSGVRTCSNLSVKLVTAYTGTGYRSSDMLNMRRQMLVSYPRLILMKSYLHIYSF